MVGTHSINKQQRFGGFVLQISFIAIRVSKLYFWMSDVWHALSNKIEDMDPPCLIYSSHTWFSSSGIGMYEIYSHLKPSVLIPRQQRNVTSFGSLCCFTKLFQAPLKTQRDTLKEEFQAPGLWSRLKWLLSLYAKNS